MQAELEAAAEEGKALPFALGCLAAAAREMPRCAEGRFVLTIHGLALGIMIPMAAFQLGCALLDLPYLYPGRDGLSGALLDAAPHEPLLRSLYQAAIAPISLLLLALAISQLRIAWAMLDRDWTRVTRLGTLMAAIAATLIIFMNVLFLDSSRALLQVAALAAELGSVAIVARWHASLFADAGAEHPG
jgi:hypothetical protein